MVIQNYVSIAAYLKHFQLFHKKKVFVYRPNIDEYKSILVRIYSMKEKLDIAIIELKINVKGENDFLKPACLPQKLPKIGSSCYIGKTGHKVFGEKEIFTLITVPLEILNEYKCKKLLKKMYSIYNDEWDVMPWDICTKNPPRKRDMCEDELGKPLICNDDGKATVYGIHSKTAANDAHQGMFAGLSNHRCFGDAALFTNVFHLSIFINCILNGYSEKICQARQDESEQICLNENPESKAPAELPFECGMLTTY